MATVAKKSPEVDPKKGGHSCCLIAGIIVAVLIGLFFLLIGFGSIFGALMLGGALKKSGFQYDAAHQSISIHDQKTGERITVGQSTTIPADFPQVPLYPGSKVVSVVSSSQTPVLVLGAKGQVDTITTYYQQSLPQKGFTVKYAAPGRVQFENNIYTGNIIILSQKEEATITIGLTKK